MTLDDYELEEYYMGHTKESAKRYRTKYKEKYGVDPYQAIGKKGGKVKHARTFDDPEMARKAVRKRWDAVNK